MPRCFLLEKEGRRRRRGGTVKGGAAPVGKEVGVFRMERASLLMVLVFGQTGY